MLEELLAKLKDNSSKSWDEDILHGRKDIGKLLAAQPEIRIFVDGSANFGHQASTVLIMRRLVQDLGYSKLLTAVVTSGGEKQLTKLVPGYTEGNLDPIDFYGAQARFIPRNTFEEHADKYPYVLLGFTGGADEDSDYTGVVRSYLFLRLQPYLWPPKESKYIRRQLEYTFPGHEEDDPHRIELETVLEPASDKAGPKLKYRAYHQPVPRFDEIPWDTYEKKGPEQQRKHVTNALVLVKNLGTHFLLPSYALRPGGQTQKDPSNLWAQLVISVLQAQTMGYPKGPAVLVNFDDQVTDDVWTQLEALLKGGPSTFEKQMQAFLQKVPPKIVELQEQASKANPEERGEIEKSIKELQTKQASYEQYMQAYKERGKYLQTLAAEKRFLPVLRVPDPTLIQSALSKVDANQVLLINLGGVPPEIYHYIFSLAKLPSIFEGAATAGQAINTGLPYLHLRHTQLAKTDVVLYPSTLASGNNYSDVAGYCQVAANAITEGIDDKVLKRPPDQCMAAALKTATFIQEAYQSESKIHRYFDEVRQFYSRPTNGILNVTLAVMNGVYQENEGKFNPKTPMLLAAEDSPLETLYKCMTEHTTPPPQSQLSLIPTCLNEGAIASFYQALLPGNDLTIDTATITPTRDDKNQLTKITVSGKTSSFGLNMDVPLLEFTDANGSLSTLGRFTSQETWQLGGIPWIGIEDAGFEINLTNGTTPTAGAILGRIKNTDLEMRVNLPPTDNKWLISGTVAKDGDASIAQVYEMAGGINLIASLPPGLKTLAGFELQQFQISHDFSTGSIEFTRFIVGTQTPWELIPEINLSIQSVTLDAVIQKPGSLKNRKLEMDVTGKFTLGGGTIQVSTHIPGFQVQGGLTEGTIRLDDILTKFLPGVSIDLKTEITTFEFNVDPTAKSYSITTGLKSDWKIGDIFTITGIDFHVENGGGETSGSVTGNTVFMPQSTNIGLSVSASYDATEKGWTFSGHNTNPIEISKLLSGDPFNFNTDSQDKKQIDKLALSLTTGDKSWTFEGSISDWKIDFLDLLIKKASLKAGYNGPKNQALLLPPLRQSNAAVLVPLVDANSLIEPASGELPAGTQPKGNYFANIDADLEWLGVNLNTWLKFSTDKGPSWGVTIPDLKLSGSVSKNSQKQWVGTLKFPDDVTVGFLIEHMVSWITGSKFGLEAPWDFLNSINLSALELVFNFSTKQVSFKVNIGPIDLGFARIDGINVSYERGNADPAKNGVQVSLAGSFPWNIGDDKVGDTGNLGPWNAAEPGAAPAPPGQGNKYFDIRMLAMGQHVTLPCFTDPDTNTVQKAIACMRNLPQPPDPGKPTIPPVQFDSQSSWLIGADFGILKIGDSKSANGKPKKPGRPSLPTKSDYQPTECLAMAETKNAPGYVFNMQVVFNDPSIYGLRIALAGDAAKIFKGLEFQIMYQQVSPTVGVYRSEITLPDIMRHLSVGAYSVTLPVFGIEIYTNGDFQVDIGFPWDEDFSRSFSIEGIIAPGIPVMGSAGFHFGKLSSASTNRVPQATNGTFNPVIVFGFGLQVGFGKSVHYGILSAGFSLTVVGIIEGVLGKWNPYPDGGTGTPRLGNNGLAESNSQIQGAYYFWLRGSVGVIGKLYGTVDFAIIKADVNVEIKLLLQMTYETYVSITISVIASVNVSVSVKINLGLFKVSVSFSFSLKLKETFTIDNHGDAPWKVGGHSQKQLLRAPADRRLRVHRALEPMILLSLTDGPNWSRLSAPTQPTPLTSWLTTALTVAHDEWKTDSQKPADQRPCYVAMLMLDSVAAPQSDKKTAALKASGAEADSSFELLAKMVLRWMVAALQSKPYTPDQIDDLVVTETQLRYLTENVLVSSDDRPTPIPEEAIESFLSAQFKLNVRQAPDQDNTGQEPHTTYFPMAPDIKLHVPAYGNQHEYNYTFAQYNAIDDSGLSFLRSYFDELAVQVEHEMAADRDDARPMALGDQSYSMAQWVMTDYFLLLARQMVQAARDGLRDFKFPIEDSSDPNHPDTPTGIVDWINAEGQLSGADAYTLDSLFAANLTHELAPGKPLTIGTRVPVEDDNTSFENFASNTLNQSLTAVEVATLNAANQSILRPGVIIQYRSTPESAPVTYTTRAGDSLLSIAGYFKVRLASGLLVRSNVLRVDQLLTAGSSLATGGVTYQVLASDTFDSIAKAAIYQSAFTAQQLAQQNAGASILRTGASVSLSGKSHTVQPAECLGDVANALGVTIEALTADSKLLSQADLMLPVAKLSLPQFNLQTTTGQTFESIATQLAVSNEIFGASAANGKIESLFVTESSGGQATPNLDVPHLTQFKVKQLLAEAQRTQVMQHLSGMASRYYLHGMRLPTANADQPIIDAQHPGMWVGDDLQLPPHAGLYALTGQQFEIPDIGTEPFTATLSAGPQWLSFEKYVQKDKQWEWEPVPELTVSVSPGSDESKFIQQVTQFAQSQPLNTQLTELGPEPMYTSQLATYPLTSSLTWQAASSIRLSYGKDPGGPPELRLWRLPDTLINLPDPAHRALDPRFGLRIGRYDEATGGTVKSDVSYYSWASTIEFTVKRVPETTAATKSTYEIMGADGNAATTLERLLAAVGDQDALIDQLIVSYPPADAKNGAGIQTGAVDGITLGIAQVNLSTDTRPPAAMDIEMFAEQAEQGRGLLNTKTEFLRWLWEASITRSGGFYLYYHDSEQKSGLPDRVFNDKGEAQLTLVVLYPRPEAANAQNVIGNYMNAAVTGESIDPAHSVVFTEADPAQDPPPQVKLTDTDTLADIAYRYYSNVGDLVELPTNTELKLADKVEVHIDHGLYFVTPNAPGGALSQIIDHFGITLDQLKQANPKRTDWPDTLPTGTALRLPKLTVVVQDSSKGGNTLASLADYFGVNLTSLAAQNQHMPGLLGADQLMTISGGPRLRTATVPPGVEALAAARPVPAELTTNLSSPESPEVFLQNMYSLLNYRVEANDDFAGSKIGLPAGPTTTPEDPDSHDKIRAPRTLTAGVDQWHYKQALPYTKFVKHSLTDEADLPAISTSPYIGVNSVLQIDFDWQDYFGNTLVTDLSSPKAGDRGPFNGAPMLTGYTDAMLGLSQWPSITSAWQLAPKLGADPQLEMLLSFDNSHYQGLLQATATDEKSVALKFTQPLDPNTANNPSNFAIEGVDVSQATLSADGLSVTLSVSGLTDGNRYSVAVRNLLTTKQQSVDGQAAFSYPNDPANQSSTVQQNAVRDLRVLRRLYYQLTDPNGISFEIQSSLLRGDDGKPGTLPVQPGPLLDWLFNGTVDATGIYAFIKDRSQFGTQTEAPPADLMISNSITADQLNPSQLFELSLSFTMKRTGGISLGDLETTPGIRQVTTRVSAMTSHLDSGDSTLGLKTFAENFEAALSQPQTLQMKVATGTNRHRVSSGGQSDTVWAVRLGERNDQHQCVQEDAICISVDEQQEPTLFAPRPISNTLESGHGVPIYDYTSGQGLSPTPSRNVDFIDIDMDSWGRQFLGDFDSLLSPKFTSTIQLVDKYQNAEFLQDILDQKKKLAGILKLWMIPLFADEHTDPTHAREAFYQQLLSRLSNAYTTRATIQRAMNVRASADQPGSATAVPAKTMARKTASESLLFNAATTTIDQLRQIQVRFNQPVDATTGGAVSNYVLTGGLTVTEASVPTGSSTVFLTISGDATPRTTQLTVGSAVKSAQGDSLQGPVQRTVFIAPRLYGNVTEREPLFDSATTTSGQLKQVVLKFNFSLDPDSAKSVENYQLSNSAKVVRATLNSTQTEVQLELDSEAELDKTTITVGELKDTLNRGILTPRTRTITSSSKIIEAKSAISLSSPKLNLVDEQGQPLTFLLSSPGLVRGEGNEVVPYVSLDVEYRGANIEHQIGAVPGIKDYAASSWLSFVIPDQQGPLSVELGQFTVPMVLRSFPASASLSDQNGQASFPNSEQLSQLTRWDYDLTYALPYHYPQDRVHASVEFNIGERVQMLAGIEDAFNQLAQFVTVMPKVQKDFDQYLGTIDATTAPDAEEVAKAAVALDAFLKMVKDITQAAENNGLIRASAYLPRQGDASLTYTFSVQEGVAVIDGVDALTITVFGKPPAGIGDPEVYVDPKHYEMQRLTANCEGDYCFWYRSRKDQKPLSASAGQAIQDRMVRLPNMDVLQRQDAWSTVYLKRNQELIPGKPTAEPFVYTTSKVQFKNPLLPTLDVDQVIPIANLNHTKPHVRSLREQLQTLFDTLLKDNVEDSLLIQVESTYEYDVTSHLSAIPLPVFMQAPLMVNVKDSATAGSGSVTLAETLDSWAGAIELWFKNHAPRPVGEPGDLYFDLSLMSNLTTQPMPLLRLRRLRLELSSVQPPLTQTAMAMV